MLFKSKLVNKTDLLALLLLILSSLVFLLDTLVYKNQPANMDGTSHITNMAVFHAALLDGDFPVRWTDGFANYGLPVGSFIQQVTSYLGGFLTFLTNNVVVSFNLVYVIATVVSVLLFYVFLRFYFRQWPSFIGAFLFNFAPYRIINTYIRGAIPEYFSSVFFISILIFLFALSRKKTWWSFIWLSFSVTGLILSHPMNVLTGAFFIVPYILYLILQEKEKIKLLILISASGVIGVLLSSYYLLPLLKDIQYFYYALYTNYYTFNSTLGLHNFLDPQWYYFITERNEILSRGHFIKTGAIEFILLLSGVVYGVIRKIKKQKFHLFDLSVIVGIITLFLTTQLAEPIYLSIDFLSNIQFPWRMLSTFIFIPPLIAAFFIDKHKKDSIQIILGMLIIVVVSWNRFAQVYGKNFTATSQDSYYFTIDNLHSSNMNTIWTTRTTEYPVHRDDKVAVLEGQADLMNVFVKNSLRTYEISAENSVRMIDYTFYYPGWKVYSDGVEVPIEFQDINHRGVITYWLPAGKHSVEVKFTQTKTVLLANAITLVSVFFIGLIIVFRKKVNQLLSKLF
ncbi:MAG: hypothetical protein BroJett025_05120 [Patescibacteria group bacterium]|nr:MAG: hypothetical protein BroJett025_05120 [Patescibacteria group bacterium]